MVGVSSGCLAPMSSRPIVKAKEQLRPEGCENFGAGSLPIRLLVGEGRSTTKPMSARPAMEMREATAEDDVSCCSPTLAA